MVYQRKQTTIVSEARREAGQLLDALLSQDLLPNQVLNRWPAAKGQDRSLDVAYTMVLYFACDDERHQEEAFYSDIQLMALETACHYLKQGMVLPADLLEAYPSSDELIMYYDDKQTLWQPFYRLKGWIKQGLKLILRAFNLGFGQS